MLKSFKYTSCSNSWPHSGKSNSGFKLIEMEWIFKLDNTIFWHDEKYFFSKFTISPSKSNSHKFFYLIVSLQNFVLKYSENIIKESNFTEM